MQFLVNSNDVVICAGIKIERGKWVNDPTTETYRVENEFNSIYQYIVISDFRLYSSDKFPEDYVPHKYCYTEETGFFLNPVYEEPITDYERGYEQALLDLAETTGGTE